MRLILRISDSDSRNPKFLVSLRFFMESLAPECLRLEAFCPISPSVRSVPPPAMSKQSNSIKALKKALTDAGHQLLADEPCSTARSPEARQAYDAYCSKLAKQAKEFVDSNQGSDSNYWELVRVMQRQLSGLEKLKKRSAEEVFYYNI